MTVRLKRTSRALLAGVVVVLLALTGCAGSSNTGSNGSSGATAGESKQAKDLKVGWSTIYLTPSWMQQTQKLLQARVDELKKDGTVKEFRVFNANGDTTAQSSQIRAMVDQKYDVILVVAGSSTALNTALDNAVAKGITVVNFDSLVTSDKVIKVGTDQKKWGEMMATWLVEKLGGKGQIIAFNGPAGVSVSEERWAGAKAVFDKTPGIKIVANLNAEYNLAPAAQVFAPAYAAHRNINGVFCQAGSHAAAVMQTLTRQKAKLIPVTGENYNGFLKLWKSNAAKGFDSLATAQPNYLATISLDAAVAKLQGKDIKNNVVVPLPRIDKSNLDQWVDTKAPDDSYPIKPLPQAEVNKLLGI